MNNKELKLNLEKYEDDIYRIFSNIDHKEIRNTLITLVEKFPNVLEDMNKYKSMSYRLSEEVSDLKSDIQILKLDVEERFFQEDNQEETLDWELVMETFYDLKPNINPWNFEKLILEEYGNKQ